MPPPGHWIVRWGVIPMLVAATGCQQVPQVELDRETAPLAASPRAVVGRILAVDLPRSLAVVDLRSSAPPSALTAGADLTARSADLKFTARLRASPHLRGRTLGVTIVSGEPSAGDEVVWNGP